MTTTIRAVFFDFQDTLARFRAGAPGIENLAYGLYLEAAREHGIDLDPRSIILPTEEAWGDYQTPQGPAHVEGSASEAAFQQVRIAVHRKRLALAGITGDLAEAIGRRIDEFEADSGRYTLFEDTIPALAALGERSVARVVLSNHVWRLNEIIEALGLTPYLEGVVTSAQAGYRKPHPEIYRAGLALSGIPAEETVMVGDSLLHDVRGAERVGIHGILLDRRGSTPPPEGVRVVHSLAEVPLRWP